MTSYSDIESEIRTLAKQGFDGTLAHRREIHSNPELSFAEHNTAAYIENELQLLGLKTNRIGITGVWAIIEGEAGDGPVVGLRADLDALPITENNSKEYISKNKGVMHACGHDVHSASLLGAAAILVKIKSKLKGKVKLIFQPGEEKLPGGASILIKEGILENPKVDLMIGQHVMPLIETGKVGFREGLYMASTDELYVTVKGKGGHGAMPHLTVDPVAITAQIIVALQQLVSRMASPIVPTVLTFGKINSTGGATNIIPSEVKLEGTFRTLDESWREKAHEKMKKLAEHIAEGFGAEIDFVIERGYPFLKNDVALTSKLTSAAKKYMGEEKVEKLDMWMAAEDFSFYSQKVPSCFYRLGTRNEGKGIISSVHTDTFDIDEDALEYGSGLMAYLAFISCGGVL
ncbi:MAG: amidohydrolase [Bacteroidia bacterium]|nr:amidohydrolase [Bacteroidia bacterium]